MMVAKQTWLTRMINKRNISLAPGGSLTNVVLVTNCPPRFRLKLAVDYLGRDSRDWPLPVGRLLPEPWKRYPIRGVGSKPEDGDPLATRVPLDTARPT